MKSIKPVCSTCPIHDRKVKGTSPLRQRLLDMIERMFTEPKNQWHRQCFIRKHLTRITMVVRPLSWFGNNKKRRVYEVTLNIVMTIRDVAGKIKKILHHFQIDFPTPTAPVIVWN
jgi:hypothetical protein